MGDSQLAVWDFRYNASTFKSESELKAVLKGIAKKWVFQLERGDEGYEHYQGRMSLIKGRRKGEKHILLKLFKETPPNYLEPTCKTEATKGDALYMMKEDTRLKGPWTDKDEVKVETTQLKIFQTFELRPYQRKLLEFARTFDMRKIDIIYDPVGNLGKSLFVEYMEYEGLAEEIPPYRLMDDIFQWVCTRPIKPCYVVDMPRGMKKDKLGDFYSGLEVLKNGVAYDKRYNATKIRFNRPRVFVFTNTLPEFSLMSRDRWNIWEVQPDYDMLLRNSMGTLSNKL